MIGSTFLFFVFVQTFFFFWTSGVERMGESETSLSSFFAAGFESNKASRRSNPLPQSVARQIVTMRRQLERRTKALDKLKKQLDIVTRSNAELLSQLIKTKAERDRLIQELGSFISLIFSPFLTKCNKAERSCSEQTPNPTRSDHQLVSEADSYAFRITAFRNKPKALRHLISVHPFAKLEELKADVEAQIGKDWEKRSNRCLDLLNTLALVLIRLRRGFTVTTLSILFGISVGVVDKLIKKFLPIVRAVYQTKVQGLVARDQLNNFIPKRVREEFPGAVLLADCTYVYIEHSKNFHLQHGSYSSHKRRNLMKFLVWVYPNGKIARVVGPFGTDVDTKILQEDLESDAMKNWLKEGDKIIVDRGFAGDDTEQAEQLGIGFIQPAFRDGKNQFTSKQVRWSKLVSSARAVQETTHIRIKANRLLFHLFPAKMIDQLEEWFSLGSFLADLFFDDLRLIDPLQQRPVQNPIPPPAPHPTANDFDRLLDVQLLRLPLEAEHIIGEELNGTHLGTLFEGFSFLSDQAALISLERELPTAGYTAAIPADLKDFNFKDEWLHKLCRYESVSEKLKSTVDRGRQYVMEPHLRLERLKFLDRIGEIFVRTSSASSYKGNKKKEHKISLRIGLYSPLIGADCTCKNGKTAKCAHIAAALLYLRLLCSGTPTQTQGKTKRRSEDYHQHFRTQKT